MVQVIRWAAGPCWKPRDLCLRSPDARHLRDTELVRDTNIHVGYARAAVSRISADITTDEKTGASYYTVRVALSAEEITHLGDVALVPGMPVEVFAKTGDRKVISYLVKPLADQITRAFREQ
jgi:hypothetical protein